MSHTRPQRQTYWSILPRFDVLRAVVLVVLVITTPLQAKAERLAFKSYSTAQGLLSLGGRCIVQDPVGYIFVCSEHGLFAYDGRKFINLGLDQGLMNGGLILDTAILKDGRIALRFPNQILVSETAASIAHPPDSLHFKPLQQTADDAYLDTGQMVPWRDKLAAIVGGRLKLFDPTTGSAGSEPTTGPLSSNPYTATLTGIFSVKDDLWATLENGRVCLVDPRPGKCWTASDPSGTEPFHFVGPGDSRHILARSDHFLATIDPVSGSEVIERLPFQGGAYDAQENKVGLFRDQRGNLVTQARDGLIVRRATGWEHLTTRDGIPAGVIANMLTDREGQVWIQIAGRGIFRGLDYGSWENLQQDDGLSEGLAWQELTDRKGSLWVTTDSALDEVRRVDGHIQVVNTIPGASYAITLSRDGKIWAGHGNASLIELDPATGRVSSIGVPSVETLVSGEHRLWVGTDHGLFHVDDQDGPRRAERDSADNGPVVAITADGHMGAYFITAGRLWHRHDDGRVSRVGGAWPPFEFTPETMIPGGPNVLWLAGAGGLFRLELSDDRVQALAQFGQHDIETNTVVALCLDHRGWLWVGTSLGVSIFDGRKWVSVNSTKGLVWDDVSQNGIYEDTDGTIWIATGQGLSHLLRPERLLEQTPPRIVVSSMRVGPSIMRATKLPYSHEPLSISLGTVSYSSEDSTIFRYRLSGVDRAWAESTTGTLRYATLPPGRHVLEAYALDTLTNAHSAPIAVSIEVAYPWWESWWAEAAYVAGLLGAIAGVVKLSKAVVQAKRREREALAALRRQATTDGLTGLMNRSEVERRIGCDLARKRSGMALAIVDVDNFKTVNDEHGHPFGDTVLREIGRKIALSLGPADYAGRYGGEELLIVLDDSQALAIERVTGFHQAIREHRFGGVQRHVAVTCSVGVAWHRMSDDCQSLIGRADAALYRAKRTGRNRIVEDRWTENDRPDMSGVINDRLIANHAD